MSSATDAAIAAVFAVVYLGMFLGGLPRLKLDRSGVALLGAIAVIALTGMGVEDAARAVDLPTIVLLFAFMVVSAQMRLGGFYAEVARRVGARPLGPAALLGALIGNPQNMLIGSVLALPFAAYLQAALPPVAASLLLLWAWLAWRLTHTESAAPAPAVAPVQLTPAPTVAAPAGLARVSSATPNLERPVQTRQQCVDQVQQLTTPGSAGLGTTIAGSLIGGAMASPIGKGGGKSMAIATGSAIGADVARQTAGSQTTTTPRTVQVCQPVSSVREQVRDDSVRYKWEGSEYQVNLTQHPGAWLRVSSSHSVQAL